jgi:molybdopterin-guanine dinucleotide biosynthesis protein A
VYRRRPVLRAVDGALLRGERRMNSYFADVRVRELEPGEWLVDDSDRRAFFNVNTPKDLAEAQVLAS